jgi:hypothetical protein
MLYSRAEHLQGSVPAIVIHVKTEFVVDSMEEMIEAVRTISLIDPSNYRNHKKISLSPVWLENIHSRIRRL